MTMTLHSPGELLAAVPYLLGFHPTDSVVLLAQRGRRVIFQARADAPPPDQVTDLARYLAEIAARQSPTGVVLVGYGDAGPIEPALTALRAAVEDTGVAVLDVLRVEGSRYWSVGCPDRRCCPPEGTPFDPAGSATAAALTYRGMVALPDRSTLVDALAARPGPGIEPELAAARERLAEVVAAGSRARVAATRAAVREALGRCDAGGRLDDDEVAWLAVLLADIRCRDEAWRRMIALRPAERHLRLWRDVLRRVPEPYVPAPAMLLALMAWRGGDGTMATLAAERALAADPRYNLADLVLRAVQAGIPPSALDPAPRPRRRRARVR